MNAPANPRPTPAAQDLDQRLERLILAEADLWATVDQGLAEAGAGLGRSHWRAAFLIRRRAGLGVLELARLTALSKQAASRVLSDLADRGLAQKTPGIADGRRRSLALTPRGLALEAAVTGSVLNRLASVELGTAL